MNHLVHSIFFKNSEIPEQICQFCQSIRSMSRPGRNITRWPRSWRRPWADSGYFTFEDRLNQYWAWENQAYYLFGLNLRREILEGFQGEG